MTQVVTSADGTRNEFPDEATPDMISQALGLDKPSAAPSSQEPPPVPLSDDPVQDKLFQQTKAGQTLTNADKYAGAGWLTKPADAMFKAYSDLGSGELGLSDETQQKLRDAGIFNDYAKGEHNWYRSVSEAVLKPAAVAGDALLTGAYAATGALSAGAFGLMNKVEEAFGGAKESSDTLANQAEDFNNFLYIQSGFAADGTPMTLNKKPKGAASTAEAGPAMKAENATPTINVPIKSEAPLTDAAGNINLDYINTTQDAKNVIRQVAEDNGGKDAFMDQRRGTISHDQTIAEGQKIIDQSANGVPEWIETWPVGRAPNAAESTAARTLLAQSATNVVQMAKTALETGTEEDKTAWQSALDKNVVIQRSVAGMAAEAGRGLNAFGIVVPGGEEAEAIEVLQKSGLKPDELMGVYGGMDSAQQAVKLMEDAKKPTFGDAALFYIMNNYLSGPITHAAYAASYFTSTILRAGVETPIAALVGKIQNWAGRTVTSSELGALKKEHANITKAITDAESNKGAMTVGDRELLKDRLDQINGLFQKHETVMPGEVGARFYGLGEGALDAVKATWKALKSGQIGKLPGEKNATAWINNNPIVRIGKDIKNPILSKVIQGGGQVVGVPTRIVGAIHTFQKVLSYSESLNALAYRQAALEGLEGSELGARIAEIKNNPSPEIMEAATQEGKYAALMGEPGKAGKAFEEWTRSNNYTRVIVPFTRVMNNINSQAFLERSPLGAFSAKVRGDILGKNGNAAQATAIGKMATGTIILAGAATLAAQGYVTGEAPDDPKERNFNYLSGNPPYSVRIGEVSLPLRFFGIPGRVMAIGADLHDVHQVYQDEDDSVAAISAAAHAIGNDVLSESGFRGIAELYQAVKDERFSQYWLPNAIASAAVPFSVGQGQINRFMLDPEMRQAHGLIDAMKAKSIGFSQTLTPKIDIFGNPLKRSGDHSWADHDPVMQALKAAESFPHDVGNRLANTKLNDQQLADYATTAGKLFYTDMSRRVAEPGWIKLDQEAQGEIIQGSAKAARAQARCYMAVRYPELTIKSCKQKLDLMNQ